MNKTTRPIALSLTVLSTAISTSSLAEPVESLETLLYPGAK